MARDSGGDDGPQPGDGASDKPRPAPDRRDVAWAGAAAALAGVTAGQLMVLTRALVGLEHAISAAGAVLGFVITVVWLLTISWVVLGCWRRSVWGCPFDHTAPEGSARHCHRHASVVNDPPPHD